MRGMRSRSAWTMSENLSMDSEYSIFDRIYKEGGWDNGGGHGSGWGSHIDYARPYVEFINGFLREHEIKSVLDIGCGDWQFSRFIDWKNSRYVGIDVVESVIEQNNRMFSKEGVSFLRCRVEYADLSQFELILLKDILQHLSLEGCSKIIDRVVSSGCRFCLMTNDTESGPDINTDIVTGGYRHLDVSLPPLGLECERVLNLGRGKETLLWRNPKIK